jgi:hypothetical protein
MSFLAYLYFALMGEEDISYFDELSAKFEVVRKFNWVSFWDRVYMQEVRATGSHPEMYVVTRDGVEAAIIIEDGEFNVVNDRGYDYHTSDWNEALSNLDMFLTATKVAAS